MKSALALLLTAAPQSAEPQLIDIDKTVFVQLAVFLLALIVLGRFFVAAVPARAHRAGRARGGLPRGGGAAGADAEQRLARADLQLAEARRVGAGERAVARSEAHAREQTLLAEANAAAQRKLADARTRLNAVVDAERKKLQADASQVATAAARKILGREVGA
jgi:F0F1-type ATP synthase membrane subunit b/b'